MHHAVLSSPQGNDTVTLTLRNPETVIRDEKLLSKLGKAAAVYEEEHSHFVTTMKGRQVGRERETVRQIEREKERKRERERERVVAVVVVIVLEYEPQ